MCEERLLELWPQLYHPRLQVFLCNGFIKFTYINKILMKTRLQFLYITCYNVNYFVSQPVGLDFASGSRYENLMGQTPCCIMWSTHNHGINIKDHLTIKLYDKRDNFNFPILNCPHLNINIPVNPAYGVYISQVCSYYKDFLIRHQVRVVFLSSVTNIWLILVTNTK